MGKYNFAPQRVHQAATRLLETKRLTAPPPWYDIIANLPPSERLVRPALQGSKKKGKKASRLFQPVQLEYKEDRLRSDFFGDHPWELARPRQVLEDDGKDYQKHDWSRLEQPGRQLDGESVVQRQAWLMRLLRHELDFTASRELRDTLRSSAFNDIQQTIKHDYAVDVDYNLPAAARDTGSDVAITLNLTYHPDQPHAFKDALSEVKKMLASNGVKAQHINQRHYNLALYSSEELQSVISDPTFADETLPNLLPRNLGIRAILQPSFSANLNGDEAQEIQSIRLTYHRNNAMKLGHAITKITDSLKISPSSIAHTPLPASDPDTFHPYSKASAYDQARKEFYAIRHRQDIERRVAREEALFTGATFGPSAIEVGMQLEDQKFEEWREWATKEILAFKQLQGAAYTGNENEAAELDLENSDIQEALGEVAPSLPASNKGQEALGGAQLHP